MTNREYFTRMMDELFDASHKTENQLAQDKKYCEFEDDIMSIVKKAFTQLGCDTSEGEPTYLGMELWLDSNVKESTKEIIERKYRKLQ